MLDDAVTRPVRLPPYTMAEFLEIRQSFLHTRSAWLAQMEQVRIDRYHVEEVRLRRQEGRRRGV
jgi:hypothetical protein